MLNKCVLIGRLCADPSLKYTPNGTAVTTFTLAINRKFNKDETDFVDCVVWRAQAESCASYLHKGSLCAVEGRLQIRTYEDKENKKRKVAEVVADDVRFLDPKGKSDSKPSSPPPSDWSNLGQEIDLGEDSDSSIPF